MNRVSQFALLACLVAFAPLVTGCDEVVKALICNDVCNTTYDCDEDILRTVDETCEVDTPAADVVDACERACDAALDELTATDRDVVSGCISCINDELGQYSTCTMDSWNNAVNACPECADDDFEQFYNAWAASYDITTYDAYDSSGNVCEWPFA